MSTYQEKIESLKHLYLEDSYVLDIFQHDNNVVINVEFVLTQAHPHYTQPVSGEKYCYARGSLVFVGASGFLWCDKPRNAISIDPDGSIDWGNIHDIHVIGGLHIVLGDFGRIEIQAKDLKCNLEREIS